MGEGLQLVYIDILRTQYLTPDVYSIILLVIAKYRAVVYMYLITFLASIPGFPSLHGIIA